MKRIDTFLESLKTIKKNKKALEELNKKIKQLQEDPIHVGGWLSGFPANTEFLAVIGSLQNGYYL